MVIAFVTVTPLGTGSPSLSPYVAECVRALDQCGLKHTLTPMGSILEGSLEEILEAVRMIHNIPFNQGVQRVSTRIVIDERRDREATAEGKVRSVQKKLAENR
ncbi:MAG: MTH1187 family thiamine-binding protein [bacterium]|nr:MAG: MTH1187 family thiamine-binding protein [bacterium]